MCTDCTSPVPVTTTFTMPPPAMPSTVVSASASCAAAMSACIFCTCFIIWLILARRRRPASVVGHFALALVPRLVGCGRRPATRPCAATIVGRTSSTTVAPRLCVRRVTESTAGSPSSGVDQLGEVDLVVVGRRCLVDRGGSRRRRRVGRAIGVEAVVGDRA